MIARLLEKRGGTLNALAAVGFVDQARRRLRPLLRGDDLAVLELLAQLADQAVRVAAGLPGAGAAADPLRAGEAARKTRRRQPLTLSSFGPGGRRSSSRKEIQ